MMEIYWWQNGVCPLCSTAEWQSRRLGVIPGRCLV